MITIGKITDRLSHDDDSTEGIIYIGKNSNSGNLELDENKGFFFDTNNIKKAMTKENTFYETTKFIENKLVPVRDKYGKNVDAVRIQEKGNVKKIDETSFINNAKFYTCKENVNNLDSLCFRCVDECVSCQSCAHCNKCNSNCHNCIESCNNSCFSCDSCNSCVTYVDGTGVKKPQRPQS